MVLYTNQRGNSGMPTVECSVTPTYEGKAKQLFQQGNELRVVFKDDATAFNGEKHDQFPGKGRLNAAISAMLFQQLQAQGLPTGFIRHGNADNELIYQALDMLPLEVVVRNTALGSFAKRYGIAHGTELTTPVVEFFLKRDDLGDPLIPISGINALNILPEGICPNTLTRIALSANILFQGIFQALNIHCADFKLEFGTNPTGELSITDELSPDNFRLRDQTTGQILDKDAFRLDDGDLLERYQTVWQRLQTLNNKDLSLDLAPYQTEVMVTSRPNVLSPESRTLTEQLALNGFSQTQTVRANKQFQVILNAAHPHAAYEQATQMATTILANPVVEDAYVLPLPTIQQ